MEEQDLEPLTLRPKPRVLEPMSIDALQDYIAEMEAEIERVRAAVNAKESWRDNAESFFKT